MGVGAAAVGDFFDAAEGDGEGVEADGAGDDEQALECGADQDGVVGDFDVDGVHGPVPPAEDAAAAGGEGHGDGAADDGEGADDEDHAGDDGPEDEGEEDGPEGPAEGGVSFAVEAAREAGAGDARGLRHREGLEEGDGVVSSGPFRHAVLAFLREGRCAERGWSGSPRTEWPAYK